MLAPMTTNCRRNSASTVVNASWSKATSALMRLLSSPTRRCAKKAMGSLSRWEYVSFLKRVSAFSVTDPKNQMRQKPKKACAANTSTSSFRMECTLLKSSSGAAQKVVGVRASIKRPSNQGKATLSKLVTSRQSMPNAKIPRCSRM